MSEMKRTARATQNDVSDRYQAPDPGSDGMENVSGVYVPSIVPVHIVNSDRRQPVGAEFGVYNTFILLPGVANAAMILPEDPYRCRAILQSRGAILVLANTQALAQFQGNISGTTLIAPLNPSGYVLNATTALEVKNQSRMWAVNSDPSVTGYISVMIERNNPKGTPQE
jgi:hypothetical protein